MHLFYYIMHIRGILMQKLPLCLTYHGGFSNGAKAVDEDVT